jgi:hypothetical protein
MYFNQIYYCGLFCRNILDELMEQSDSESTKRIRRGASPSHFNLPPQQQAAYEPPHLATLPDRIKCTFAFSPEYLFVWYV